MTELSNPGRNGGRLVRHPKGVSGNPKGRQKKLRDLDQLMAKVMGEDEDGKSEAEAILVAMIRKAKRGDVPAATMLYDRAYGKPKQSVDLAATITTPPVLNILVHSKPDGQ